MCVYVLMAVHSKSKGKSEQFYRAEIRLRAVRKSWYMYVLRGTAVTKAIFFDLKTNLARH